MRDHPKLTARQQEILDLIQTAISRTGAPPTRAEIASKLGFKSANSAEDHLKALARKGVIELVSGTSRGIRLQSDTVRSINAARGTRFSSPLAGVSNATAGLGRVVQELAQLALPLIGRVSAGSPILAQEHVDQTYTVEGGLFQQQPDYLLKVEGLVPGHTLDELRAAGFRIALDDFGTGYSSLSYLQRFAVDKIKIDRSFVANIGEGSDSTAIVNAVVTLGRSMGLTVNAEGVETAAQRDFLRAAGCDEMQGFLFSKAVPEAEITKRLQRAPAAT